MFELTLSAIGLVAFFLVLDYLVYFVIKPSREVRLASGFVSLGLFFWFLTTSTGKQMVLDVVQKVKQDLQGDSKVQAAMDVAAATFVCAGYWIANRAFVAHTTGQPALLTGALLSTLFFA